MKIIALLLLLCLAAQAHETTASWYGDELRGHTMANGQPFVPEHLTCASWSYPLGTSIRVGCNGVTVVVTVTDRGPAKRLARKGRGIDLSLGAWKSLGLDPAQGLATVEIIP